MGVSSGGGSGTAIPVSISSSSERPSAAFRLPPWLVEEERLAHCRERLGQREGEVALNPRAGSSRICAPGARRTPTRARKSAYHDRRSGRGGGARPRRFAVADVVVSSASRTGSRCWASTLWSHGVDAEQRDREHDCLRVSGSREKRAISTSGRRRGRYCDPIPTAIARRTPPVDELEGYRPTR